MQGAAPSQSGVPSCGIRTPGLPGLPVLPFLLLLSQLFSDLNIPSTFRHTPPSAISYFSHIAYLAATAARLSVLVNVPFVRRLVGSSTDRSALPPLEQPHIPVALFQSSSAALSAPQPDPPPSSLLFARSRFARARHFDS